MNFENKGINIKNISLSSSSYPEEKKSITREMNEMYWKNMDMILDAYKKENHEAYLLAQKKGEELMAFDYNDPHKFVEENENKEYGKKIHRDIVYNGLSREDLDEHDKKCLKIYLGKDDIDYLFESEE